jgi:hypothetical protein
MYSSKKTNNRLSQIPNSNNSCKRQTTKKINMNVFFLAVLALFAVASSVQGEKVTLSSNGQWSSIVSMQMKKSGAQVAPACSEAALSVLKIEVGEWLRDELADLFGEAAFTLGQVTGVEEGDAISFTASVECLDCSKVSDKKSIAYMIMFFMQHMVDEWIEENNAGVLAGCMGEDTTVLNVSIGEKVLLSSSGQWSSDVSMQMKKSGAQVAPACSEAALSVLKNEVSEWLRDELIDLFGEAAFTLGQVTGVEEGDAISFTASVECLDCGKVSDKKAIAYMIMLFMQHAVHEWIEENNAGVLAGCMGEDTTVLNVSIGGKKAAALMQRISWDTSTFLPR